MRSETEADLLGLIGRVLLTSGFGGVYGGCLRGRRTRLRDLVVNDSFRIFPYFTYFYGPSTGCPCPPLCLARAS
jgi:hypothetical protein